jgi:hypothetical protein
MPELNPTLYFSLGSGIGSDVLPADQPRTMARNTHTIKR